MSATASAPPDVRALRRALEPGGGGRRDAAAALAGAARARRALADPLGAHARASAPDPALRAALVARPEVALPGAPGQPPLRLAADAVSVALALADELCVGEADAARLLLDARPGALRRHDRDVVAAAKEVHYARRRELVLFLQELLRVHLLGGADRAAGDDAELQDALVRERDALLVEHGLFANLLARLDAGLASLAAPTAANPRPAPADRAAALAVDEAVLLAESVFLVAYSVQSSSREALAVRALLEKLVRVVASVAAEEEAHAARHAHPSHHHPHQGGHPGAAGPSAPPTPPSPAPSPSPSPVFARAQSARNLVFLAWICCIDRSRYSDLYDPRTGASGVNALLRDPAFIRRSCCLPPLSAEEDPAAELAPIAPALAAAELGGALFRMAVAEPDTEEAISVVLRTCAFADALEFLADDLAPWIATGAGSLLPDANLYADVFEDFVFDLSEAPDLAPTLFRHTQEEVAQAAAAAAAAYEASGHPADSFASTPAVGTPGPAARRPPAPLVAGKPPKLPAPGRPPHGGGARPGRSAAAANGGGDGAAFGGYGGGVAADLPGLRKPKNLVSLLGGLVARAVQLAPSKLLCDSVGGGQRYWAGVGPDALGIISRMSECVLDMSDAAFRGPEGGSPYGEAFHESLDAFLKVLAAAARPGGSVVHAAASLRYLCHSGHSMVSMENAVYQLSHHYEVLSTPASARPAPLAESDSACLVGLLDVIANCAESMQPHGGMSPIVGRSAADLPPRVTALALQDVSSRLRASLVRTLTALGDNRSSLMFLEDVVRNKATKLRHMIRGQEAELGVYDATVGVLRLAALSCGWAADEFSSYAVEGAAAFAVDEVISHWSQRKYASDAERWRLMRSATELLLAIVHKEQREGEVFVLANSVFRKLLCPAPGTGAASAALRALISCTGLRRTADDGLFPSASPPAGGHTYPPASHAPESPGYLYRSEGRDSLARAALVGDGAAFKEMERAAAACARTLTFTLTLSPSQFSSHVMAAARASDLLLSEPRAIVAAGSLVFAIDECTAKPSPFRLGYSTATCAAILSMLAAAASQSSLICKLLTRADDPASSCQFRCSIADVIASYNVSNAIGGSDGHWLDGGGVAGHGDRDSDAADGELMQDDAPAAGGDSSMDRPRMHSALHLVEACLGMDGGGKPGLYLLGLVMDAGDRLLDAEYGVLSSLMELVSGIGRGSSNRVDDRSRSTAAVFLERLAGNTTAKTSCAVLDFVRNVGAAPNRGGSGDGAGGERFCGGFGDVMLARILDFYDAPDEDTDWASLGDLASACMKLSALLVRQFPGEEQDSFACAGQVGAAGFAGHSYGGGAGSWAGPELPSPDRLLRLVATVAGKGKAESAVDAFRNWHQLLGSRLAVHPQGRGYGNIPLLLDLSVALLDALESADTSGDLSVLAAQDGGAQAAAVVLRCLGQIALMVTSQAQSPDEFLGDSQAGMLLSKVVRAIAGRAEGRGDAAQTRTSLYAAFLVCGQLSEAKATDESIAHAFGGRMGARQASGAEALVAVACEDAVSGPAAATRAAALVSLSVSARLDPLRVIPALSSQNRLRRVLSSAIADPAVQAKIVRSCTRVTAEDDQAASEKAAVVVAEAALCLVHAVASAVDGVRALSDAACLESVASLLEALSAPRHRIYSEGGGVGGEPRGRGLAPGGRSRAGDQGESDADEGDDGGSSDWPAYVDCGESPEERSAAVAGILTAAVAAAAFGSDSILVDGALATLHAGETLYARLIRSLGRPRSVYLSAVSHLSMVLSRIPPRVLSDGAVPSQLRSLLACHVGCLAPAANSDADVGKSGSPLSVGLHRVVPRDAREARRCHTEHPEGGSLFERDMVAARLECLKCIFAALRPPVGLLTFFFPRFTSGAARDDDRVDSEQPGFVDELTGRQGDLGDILRIARAALDAMHHGAEESMRLMSTVSEETPTSVPSRRLAELSRYCMEELDIAEEEQVTGEAVLSCLRDAAVAARQQADSCVVVLESALFVLREYTSAATEALRGKNYGVHAGEQCPLTVRDAELLMDDAKSVLAPLCRDIDALSTTVWGRQDPSFSRQLSRQIRTNLTAAR